MFTLAQVPQGQVLAFRNAEDRFMPGRHDRLRRVVGRTGTLRQDVEAVAVETKVDPPPRHGVRTGRLAPIGWFFRQPVYYS